MADLPRRVFQCFGGPACGQLHEATLASGRMRINGRLFHFDLETCQYRGTVILHEATYEPEIIPIGTGNDYRTMTVLKWKPPRPEAEPDGA